MKVPKSYEGKVVAVHLAQPVYMFGYGAHVRIDGVEHVAAAPIMRQVPAGNGIDGPPKQSPAMSNMLVGALVVGVEDDSVTFMLFDPDTSGHKGVTVHKTVPSALIASIDAVVGVDVPMPIPVPRSTLIVPR